MFSPCWNNLDSTEQFGVLLVLGDKHEGGDRDGDTTVEPLGSGDIVSRDLEPNECEDFDCDTSFDLGVLFA